jgi:hypothetical protein
MVAISHGHLSESPNFATWAIPPRDKDSIPCIIFIFYHITVLFVHINWHHFSRGDLFKPSVKIDHRNTCFRRNQQQYFLLQCIIMMYTFHACTPGVSSRPYDDKKALAFPKPELPRHRGIKPQKMLWLEGANDHLPFACRSGKCVPKAWSTGHATRLEISGIASQFAT